MLTKTSQIFILLFTVVILLSSCKTVSPNYNTVYKPAPEPRKGMSQGKSLFVAEIIDERSINEQSPFDQNDPMILLPLWPYSHAEVNPVIKYSYFQSGLKDSLSRLIGKDLAGSELFSKFKIATSEDNPPSQPSKDDFQLILRLKKASWDRYLTSYGLSYAGMYLWFLLPKSYGSVVFTMEITIRAPETNRIIADAIYTDKISTTEWIYDQMNYQPPISVFALEKTFPKLMKKIRTMLLTAMKEK
jgi:hypothetical protein